MRELQFAPLSDFADVTMGQSPDAALCNTEERGLPFLQGCAEFGATHPETNIYCAPPLRVAKSGSVLISVRAPVGTMNYADQDYCIGRGLGAFKAKPGLANTIFLKHAVELNAGYLHRRSQGSTFAAVSTTDVRSVPVPAFRIQIQERIASVLSCIDTAIEKTEALIAKHQQIKAGLMHDLFTRGVLPNGQLRPPRSEAPELYQQTAIGWVPKGWCVERLGSMLEESGGYLHTGPFGSQLHASEYREEGVPVVMPQDINEGLIDEVSIARISEGRAATLARHRLKVGDIIIARRGELSRAAAIRDLHANWVCGTGCFLLRLGRTGLNHFFFSLAYRFDYVQRQIAGMQVGSTMPSLNNSVMSRVLFPRPSPSEQDEITLRLHAVEGEIAGIAHQAEKLQKQKLGLMQDLLTGRVPLPAAPEPAEAAT